MPRGISNVKEAPITHELFDEAELLELEQFAQDQIKADRKKAAKADLIEQFKKRELSKVDPNEEIIEHEIVLPAFAPYVAIDGVQYHNNVVYKFSRRMLDSVRDIVQGAWKHEEVTFGRRDPNAFARIRNQSVGPNTSLQFNNHFTRV